MRLILETPLPLQVGDRVLLRDPGRRHVVGGRRCSTPHRLTDRRGAAKARAASLATDHGNPDAGAELKRRGAASRGLLAAIGVPSATLSTRRDLRRVVAGRRDRSGRNGGARSMTSSIVDRPGSSMPASAMRIWSERSASTTRSWCHPLVRSCPDLEDAGGRVRGVGAHRRSGRISRRLCRDLQDRLKPNPSPHPSSRASAPSGSAAANLARQPRRARSCSCPETSRSFRPRQMLPLSDCVSCRSRSRSPRLVRRSAPPGESPSRCSSTSTGSASLNESTAICAGCGSSRPACAPNVG